MQLANKYRPKCLDDLVGQSAVVQTITNAIKNNSLHTAYLLTGFWGSGKTSTARILASMVNCEVSPGTHPCGKCETCEKIFQGKHTDVLEIDAASGAGNVDQIRRLKQDALYNPVTGVKTKIFIIDEAHSMSAASNDALLKVLEEPPPRVMFILCTTDPQKIKATIESRCQRHDFKKIPWSLISENLERICQKEKIQAEAGALNLCARLSSGSMRSAIQNLDKLIDYVGSCILTSDHAQKLFAQASENLYYDVVDEIIGVIDGKPDAANGFKIINNILTSGVSFAVVYESLIEQMRSLMVGLTCSRAGELINVSEEGKRRLSIQLKKCKESNKLNAVLESIEHLINAKTAVDKNISVDVALQRWLVESIFAFRR